MSDRRGRGAYGFRLSPADDWTALPDLGPLPADAPEVSVRWRFASAWADREAVAADSVTMAQRGQGALHVTRTPRAVLGSLPEVVSDAAIVHPLLALPMALHAHWNGWGVVHGGAFEAAGAAWVLLGDKRAGKSTVLATLGAGGVPIVADDLVVLDGETVLAGPRCVDLRPDAAPRFTGAVSIGVVAGNHRFRLPTPPPSAARLPLGGVFLLDWRAEPGLAVTDVDVGELLRIVHGQHYAGLLGPPAPSAMMAVLGVPARRVTRDRTWPRVDDTVAALLAAAQSGDVASQA